MGGNKQRYRQLALKKPEAYEDFPFKLDVAVYKVRGKMFATLSRVNGIWNMNLKCDPNQAQLFREIYDSVIPGWHMNKKHWNTLLLDGSIPENEIQYMIDHSYMLVVNGLMKTDRQYLALRYSELELYGLSTDRMWHESGPSLK
ncbi:MmcQ/YjbR family DNA-binding protein [Candidatus Spongiihabitans sp.]|uniref:MmcQ/YjbR family DNA-binding protein n=1 Tax=Candidatus Spongiihabitans sp. TaxID=3101308 RepID=UPI003C7041F6